MNSAHKKWVAALVSVLLLLFAAFYASQWVSAAPVFYDDFSAGTFAGWSQTRIGSGSSQTVEGGVARFIVPTPPGGSVSYSYLIKDGFTSTVNSTITASQDILVKQVPNGCLEGNGAIFFLYICDSSDLAGNLGNFGVGIDGSSVWSLWIGGATVYTYIFQTQGSPPASNTWYHVALTVDNSAGIVSLAVDGKVVISATQQQFTNRTHQFSLMSGLGENWWSNGPSQLEIKVDNVRLDVSDADTWVTPSPASPPTSKAPSPATTAPTHSATPNPSNNAAPTYGSTPSQSPFPTDMKTSKEPSIPLWLAAPVIVAVVILCGVLFALKKR
jgi:hypothetical protein